MPYIDLKCLLLSTTLDSTPTIELKSRTSQLDSASDKCEGSSNQLKCNVSFPHTEPSRIFPESDGSSINRIWRAFALVPHRTENFKLSTDELVWEFFRDSAGKPQFELAPMTFREPRSSEPMAIWKDYYAKLGVPIPEGVAGSNPGGLSRSDKINIVHVYDRPKGWTDETWHHYVNSATNEPVR